jgi:translation initiation factor 5B
MRIRSPIVATLGHVDHGKTTVLDSIRGSNVAAKEAGKITQMIGASYIARETIDRMSESLPGKMRVTLKIPGLLFIDTPGHEAFTNLRDRGGSIADIAMLVVDVMQGFQPQTVESIRILRQYKTPFVLVANKIDMVQGWKSYKDEPFLSSLAKQPEHVQQRLDEKIYELVGTLSENGFESERFDRITDFSKQIAIVPVSARSREGLSELLMLIAGLSQRFLEGKLEIEEAGRGRGSIIEVKEEKGMGTTLDVILFDGILRKNDEVLFLTSEGAKKTRVRGLLVPNLSGTERFTHVDEAVAAAGVKIFASDLDNALPGSPLDVVEDFERDRTEIEAKFKSVVFEKKGEAGVILRADSLGSVEALVKLLTDAGIPVKDAGVGKITRKDVVSAKTVAAEDRYLGVVLGFNVQTLEEASLESTDSGIPVIWSDIIYHLLDRYREWVATEKEKEKKEALAHFTWPGKMKALPGFCFRVSKPAIFGIEVLGGRIKRGYRLMNRAGEIVGEVREIQREKEKVDEAAAGQQLAISCDGINYGKNVNENDILYVYLTSDEIKMWEEKKEMLAGDEKAVFEEVKQMQRRFF